MKTIVLGAGIIGISTAWHLLERGHDVIVVDRQPDASLETSYANAAQISVSYCEPWANREAPWKALKWMFDKEAPLLFRPQLDWDQWRWSLKFLAQCNDAAFARNVQQIVALGAYSHAALKDMVRSTGIEYHRLERGIAHFYTDQKSFDAAGKAVDLMRQYGVQRRLVSRDELLQIEPAFRAYGDRITGGTYTSTDESGDARVFTQALARRCAERGAQFLFGHDVLRLQRTGDAIDTVTVRSREPGSAAQELRADAFVVACGSYTAPLLRTVGVDLPIYPGKGYSATFPLLKPEGAPMVSTIDDGKKIAMSRLGNFLRVAGTIELGGFDLSLDSPVARARCHMLSRRIAEILPGVCDTRTPEEGGDPQYWTGLRPATPTNIPFIGRTRVGKLWVNAGHGTLGWTHGAGSGKAMAELLSGERPAMDFGFLGFGTQGRQASGTPVTA
ncbi:D-amino acid dehydrogenase [Paracidovorax citrulli]|uniref:D-amino-acid dehydrogenase n=2 Tax=Paracidovorax citrulli TaxID=80869 RepID=A1TIF5_PARC0|nr:D-amino acid dehydrogenase [Paracidovorax citrulli]ABM30743.1 D-amino-acid dehydrogenase [Paracidovorax citrulli AAC00-1]ATG96066.1 D-amino acid dehydrogenase [Paracidovorax citrulli]MVT37783.1 FAD-dependent oxidoreductase [Paracidovorax citrulli]PVY64915.1 glycine/D-amino acid oxidase-like deaminating enzyme [Paracidovorax citrulli]REG70892.1 glycine/D-amino acid oxidase-like deaminating enzyme [Paracidovorax citrulli]